ncbi:hypothetical protein F8C76_06720 [Flagellimonas olearia]|uniref:DUF5018 domain-containing protein n=1 Tax=Flagellimonas olearia TaxID=552546 RepID=A0A6I1E060_9FLAO|nr:DUF5018 domain-containing protein [Allomuricauda olearia]KAB7531183.1 hypothetical protein F8C76_06720 [Allomuricauda olearia]
MKKYLTKTLILFLIIGCSKDEESVEIPLSSENYVLNFELPVNGEFIQGNVNDTSNTIEFNMQNAILENLAPKVTVSAKSTLTPSSSIPQDFNSSIFYTVTAENGNERIYEVIVNNAQLNSENSVLLFELEMNGEPIAGTIDEEEKLIEFNVAGAELTNLKPTVQISEGASIDPSPDIAQDFSRIVPYIITASDGTPVIYRVIVNNRPLSEERNIESFTVTDGTTMVEASIDEELGIITFDFGENDLTDLEAQVSISQYASLSPELNSIQDFTNPVVYTVTAENGEEKEYKVIANMPRITNIGGYSFQPKFFVGAEMSISGSFIDLSLPGSSIYLFDGTNTYPLDIVQYSDYMNGLTENSYINTVIPDATPTYSNYKILYEVNGVQTISSVTVDIKQEDAPLPLTVDKEVYHLNEEMVVTGENLTAYIAIPAPNGSIYLMDPRGSDISVNPEKTNMRVVLDRFPVFPSYYGKEPTETEIWFLEDGRRGRKITAVFD